MNDTMWLYASAVLIAVIHTLLGPDHYLPFVAMARAGGWSTRKTATVTVLCGFGHVLGSVALGLLGLGAGIALTQVERWEQFRSNVAGWLLLGFGVAYLVWGVRRAIRNQPHTHLHVHADGTVHSHEHTHHAEHVHVHARSKQRCEAGGYTPWILFTVFLFGPCEPLIPLLMYPAASRDFAAVLGVVVLFGVTTATTMLILVLIATRAGAASLPSRFARYGHALAGVVIVSCGVAVQLGL